MIWVKIIITNAKVDKKNGPNYRTQKNNIALSQPGEQN